MEDKSVNWLPVEGLWYQQEAAKQAPRGSRKPPHNIFCSSEFCFLILHNFKICPFFCLFVFISVASKLTELLFVFLNVAAPPPPLFLFSYFHLINSNLEDLCLCAAVLPSSSQCDWQAGPHTSPSGWRAGGGRVCGRWVAATSQVVLSPPNTCSWVQVLLPLLPLLH